MVRVQIIHYCVIDDKMYRIEDGETWQMIETLAVHNIKRVSFLLLQNDSHDNSTFENGNYRNTNNFLS